MATKDFRLNGWFQLPLKDDQGALNEDDLELLIIGALRGVGIVFHGGPVVFNTGVSP